MIIMIEPMSKICALLEKPVIAIKSSKISGLSAMIITDDQKRIMITKNWFPALCSLLALTKAAMIIAATPNNPIRRIVISSTKT